MRRKRIVVTMRVVWQILIHAVRGNEADIHKAIFDGFIELGGVYIKFLQVLSLNSRFMASWNSADKFKVFDSVRADELDIHETLERELGDRKQRIVAVDSIPFAAGSFAQVYGARLDDGTSVVLKVQRPSLRELLSFDLKLLQIFVWIVNFIGSDLLEGMSNVFKDFKQATLDETNYVHEREFGNEMHEHYRNHPKIVIPYTYAELSTDRMITQQRIDGLPVTKLIEMHNTGYDPQAHVMKTMGSNMTWQMELVGTELLYGIFVLPRVQGDPHPGNILLLPDNKVGVIDFGVSAPPPDDKLAFLGVMRGYVDMYSGGRDMGDFLMKILRFFARDLYRAMMTIAKHNQRYDQDAPDMIEIFKGTVERSFEANAGNVDVNQLIRQGNLYRLLQETVNENNRYSIKMSVDGALMLRAANIYMSMLASLGIKKDVLTQTFNNVIYAVETNHSALVDKAAKGTDIGEAIEIVSEWLESIAEKDPALSRKLAESVRNRTKER